MYTRDIARTSSTFMSKVYFWMMLGLLISGVIAFEISSSPTMIATIFKSSYLFLVLIIAQIGVVILLSALINKMSAGLTTFLYLFYSALSGVTFSAIFLTFTRSSIAEAFFITSFAFVGLSLYGTFTKRDLGPLGTFCMTGLFGLIGFILITLLFPSINTTAVSMTINTLAILIFAGLTAYDTQKIKALGLSVGPEGMQKAAITGALMLYLDFINLFLNILSLFGDRK